MKKIILPILLFFTLNIFAQNSPPDKPITPKEWIENMNYGSWWIFTPPNKNDNWIFTDNYSPRILDSLQALGINGGRLHWQAADDFDETLHIPRYIIDFYDGIIDDMMDRGMSICLQVHFTDKDMTKEIRQRTYNGWRQVCEAFKNKSHYLAMCPVIEFHGWDNYYVVDGDTVWSTDPEYDHKVKRDSLNWLYDTLTVIFRETNPDRIMSYKPWGSSKRGEFETLDFPFGNDPGPHSGEPVYYMASMSGSYGLGDWYKWAPAMDSQTLKYIKEQTMRAGFADKDFGLHHAINYRDTSGIQFWVDHWDPAYWKRYGEGETKQWSIDQNLAYIEFFMDTLKAVGSAGAGMQTNKFWNDKKDDLIRLGDSFWKGNADTDTMSVKLMKLLKSKVDTSTSIRKRRFSFDVSVYPNPASSYFYVKLPQKANVVLYDMSGSQILRSDKRVIRLDDVQTGIYLVMVKDRNDKTLGWSKLVVKK